MEDNKDKNLNTVFGNNIKMLRLSKIPARKRAEKTEEKLLRFSVPVSPVKNRKERKEKVGQKEKIEKIGESKV